MRLGHPQKLRTLGIANGYPLCCIEFFLGEWRTHWRQRDRWSYLRRFGCDGYVPCPKCRKSEVN